MRTDSRSANHMLEAAEPPTVGGRILQVISSAGLGAIVLPALATIGSPVRAPVWQGFTGAVIAAVAASVAARYQRLWYERVAGVLMAGVACWLLAQASYPVAAWLVAPALGLAIALASGDRSLRRVDGGAWLPAGAAILAAAILVVLRMFGGRDTAMAVGATIVAVAGGAGIWLHRRDLIFAKRAWLFALGGPVLVLVTASYIGATTPSATWFGSLTYHGPRDANEVALTFDDGPNPPFTLEISAILDQSGAKGTFFTVGEALESRPDVSRALLDDGQLLGNHSFTHDAFRWLDPGYAELGDTQDAFKRTLGVCPAFYRPPHGSHTPFMARVVENAGMTMVTWDVSAGDWATNDGRLVAMRVLDRVRPGSIILLHDGIDGNIGADRGVILEALPLILDGLRERGLQPVTLDKLLGKPGYLGAC